MSKKVTVQIESDDAGDMRVNTLLDEAFASPSAPSVSPPGTILRNNPELEEAFADLFEKAAESAAASVQAAGPKAVATARPPDIAAGRIDDAAARGWGFESGAAYDAYLFGGRPADTRTEDGPQANREPEWVSQLRTAVEGMKRQRYGDIADLTDPGASTRVPVGRPVPTVYQPARNVERIPTVGPAPGFDAGLQADLIAWRKKRADDERRRQEEADAESRRKGNVAYGVGNLARTVTTGGMSSGSGIAQGLAQLNNAGALGNVGAGFGPAAMGVGAAVDAGVKVVKGGFDAFRGALETAGTAAKQAFSNDGLGLVKTGAEAAAKGLEAIPVVGGMASSALKALVAPLDLFQTMLKAASGRAHELAQYSPEIARAESMAEMRQVFADMKEANEMGAKYAEVIRKEQELNQKFQEALQPLKDAILEMLPGMADAVINMLPVMVACLETLGAIAKALLGPFAGIMEELRKARRAVEAMKKDDDGGPNAFDEIRGAMAQLQIPGAGRPPAAKPGNWFQRAMNMPFLMNPPKG